MSPLWFRSAREAVRGRGREAAGQLALITVLYLIYRFGRILVVHHESRAFDNARTVWDLERLLHLPSETSLNGLFADSAALAVPANAYYATVHFPFAVATLLWLWVFRARLYRWTRNVMVGLTGTALIIHILFPLAPPRMFPDLGLVDLAAEYGQSVYGSPETDTLSNQFAAMPSLHIGWALLLSLALFFAFRSRWRWLFLAHPVLTTLVVVATANHYWLDGLVATALMLAAIAVVARWTSPTRHRKRAEPPVHAPAAPGDDARHIASRQVVARGDNSNVVPGVCPDAVSLFNRIRRRVVPRIELPSSRPAASPASGPPEPVPAGRPGGPASG